MVVGQKHSTPYLLGQEVDTKSLFPRRRSEILAGALSGEEPSVDKKPNGVKGRGHRAARAVADVFEKGRVVMDLRLRDEVRRLVIVVRRVTNGSDVGLD